MKRLVKILLAGSLLWFSGCSVNQLQKKEVIKPKIDHNLPKINSTSIKFIPDINAISLEWQGYEEANVYGYHIYRSNLQQDGEKLKRIATIKNRYSNHYLDDEDLKPNTTYLYAISVIGPNDTESIISDAVKINTYPVIEPVSLLIAKSNLPRSVKLFWRPHTNIAVNKYIIERKSLQGDKWSRLKIIKNRLNAEYIDTRLKDDTTYSYRIKAMRFDGIVSEPSKVAIATTRALPKGGLNLKATINQPRNITLHWEMTQDPNVVKYNIYHSSSANGYYNLLVSAPVDTNTFEDKLNENGKIKFYKITTVDKDGLESDLKTITPVMGKTIAQPVKPTITLALIQDNKVILNWKSGDNRAVAYNIYKKIDRGFFQPSEIKVIKNIQGLRFEDGDIVRGVTYKYSIEAIDKDGIVSQKTDEVILTFPKLKEAK
jgi:fibronectin type 3 domain-containing protein